MSKFGKLILKEKFEKWLRDNCEPIKTFSGYICQNFYKIKNKDLHQHTGERTHKEYLFKIWKKWLNK